MPRQRHILTRHILPCIPPSFAMLWQTMHSERFGLRIWIECNGCALVTGDHQTCLCKYVGCSLHGLFFTSYKPRMLTLLELQSHFWGNPLKFQVVCPQIGTVVLKGLTGESQKLYFSRGNLSPRPACYGGLTAFLLE